MRPEDRYPLLLSPIGLGPLRLDSRVVMSGHGMNFAERLPSERLHAYMVERARGGAALVTINSSPVHPSAFHFREKQLALWDEAVVPGLAAIAEEVRAAGSHLSIILWHGGHHVTFRNGRAALAPSPIPSVTTGEVPREITAAEIRELVEHYGRSTANCRQAGLSAVEVQTSSDYLLGSFLSPTLNRRTDAYGGSPERRARIVVEVLEAVREAAGPDMAVGVRTSAAHLFPLDPDGLRLEHSLPAMQLLAGQGLVDWVSVMHGSHASGEEMVPPMQDGRPGAIELAGRFRAELPVPVIVAGNIRTPEEAEAVLAEGKADLVAMARTLIAEPHWVAKVRRGETARIRPCISCNQGCWGHVGHGTTGTCVLNPEAGRERELPPLGTAAVPGRRVAVVGGGPAGLEAARLAALRGHRVTLYERQERLGGDLRLAGEAPGRGGILRAVEWWASELDLLGVEVRLGEAVDPAGPPDADAVVWAVGARPGPTIVWKHRPQLVQGIPGTEGCAHGRELLAGERTVAGSVLVIDEEGAWPAVSTVDWLCTRPEVTAVTVVTTWTLFGDPDLVRTNELRAVHARLRERGVGVHAMSFVESVEGGVARLVGGGELGPFDAVVLCTGTVAPRLAEGALAAGDCVAPRGWWAATHDAAVLVRGL